jgi:ATP-dependent RNA helicase DeaD
MTDSDPKPRSFKDLNLSAPVAQAILERGYAEPTPVQTATFDPACAGQDLVVQARTGTGKTAAFALPLVSSRVRPETVGVQALILCPTRELALQVAQEVEALAKHTTLQVASVYGGASITKQIEQLQAGAHIVVGTPGRVLDHLKRKTLKVDALRSFILDECDEMLSMGFLPQITDIWAQLPAGHQTLLFSATVPKDVTRIAETRLKNPVFITLSGDHVGALEIQHFVYLSHGDKLAELLQIIEVENPESAIVFCNTRDETKRVALQLQDRGFKADWLNADLSQAEREQVMKRLRDEDMRFLVCTDVAARGIDVSHLTHVINFDFPEASENYVHRTGRTGRAGRMGTAISLINPGSIGDLYYLRLKYKIQPQERHLPTRQELKTRQEADVIASLLLKFSGHAIAETHHQLARRLLASDVAETLVAGLLFEQLGNPEAATQAAATQRRLERPRPALRPTHGDTTKRRGSAAAPGPRLRDADSGAPSRDRAGRTRSRSRGELPFRYEVQDAPPLDNSPEQTDLERPELDTERTTAVADERPERGADRGLNRGADRRRDKPPARGHAVAAAAESQGVATQDAPVAGADGSADGPRDESDQAKEHYVNLFFGVGRRDGASSKDLEVVLSEAGIAQADLGRILVKHGHSLVQVAPHLQQQVITRLNGSTICGREALVELARRRE